MLVLSQFLEEQYALDLVADGAERAGYLLKEKVANANLFVDAVQRVASGGSALDPDVIARMIGRRCAHSALEDLTPREHEVLALMAEGHSNTGIARSVRHGPRGRTPCNRDLPEARPPADQSSQHRRVLAVFSYLNG